MSNRREKSLARSLNRPAHCPGGRKRGSGLFHGWRYGCNFKFTSVSRTTNNNSKIWILELGLISVQPNFGTEKPRAFYFQGFCGKLPILGRVTCLFFCLLQVDSRWLFVPPRPNGTSSDLIREGPSPDEFGCFIHLVRYGGMPRCGSWAESCLFPSILVFSAGIFPGSKGVKMAQS